MFFIEIYDYNTNELSFLPFGYEDRTVACVSGQNYIKNQYLNGNDHRLFYRVMKVS